jgi:DNA modification methylase
VCDSAIIGPVKIMHEAIVSNEPMGSARTLTLDGNVKNSASREDNKLRPEDRAAHDWYRFVLSFPPHLVRDYLQRFGMDSSKRVLDPFCGTGTTLVECKKLGIPSVGIESNPMACFASQIKVDWGVDSNGLLRHANAVARRALAELESQSIVDDGDDLPLFSRAHKALTNLRTLPAEAWKLLLKESISPLPLHKTLTLLEAIEGQKDQRFSQHERLALAKALVFGISNLHFGPEVGVRPARADAPVITAWLKGVRAMSDELRHLQARADTEAIVHRADARQLSDVLEPLSVDAVITSPPYPNEKDYTRTTRLESVLLGFIRNKEELRCLKRGLIRSNTRGVYKDDQDDMLVVRHREIQRIADAIERRRIELGKTSGFERLYGRVTKLYFGGMARHLAELRPILRPGALLAYVVGDQASYLQVMIRTGKLLSEIAECLGYEAVALDLFRTRLATATKEQLREEVVILRWPGKGKSAYDPAMDVLARPR